MPNPSETPPKGISGEALADWWREHGANMQHVEILSDDERICPRCGDVQPCTGTDECTSCGASLKGAKRRRRNLFQSQ